MNAAVYRRIFAGLLVNEQGKTVAHRPSLLADDPAEVEAAVRTEMLQQATLRQDNHARLVIDPARCQILLEHDVRPRDFFPLVADNPFVPQGREAIYATGLHAGLTGDLLVAVHLLIPQLEHSIRHVLAGRGVITSGLDARGIQDERNLNTLLYLPAMRPIFGDDITLDLQGLLVERHGSNLRNRLAHGLLHHDEFFSPRVLYLWWLTLRLCAWPLLVARYGESPIAEPPPEGGTSGTAGTVEEQGW